MAEYITHPLIKPNTIEARPYQQSMLATAISKNTLCVLPTALGKTALSLMLAAHRLQKFPEFKIIFMAPTKPLVEQHFSFFNKALKIEPEGMAVFTGEIQPEHRLQLWEKIKIGFATPQCVENDLVSSRLNLKNVGLVIFDEAHRCIGDYSYKFIADQYIKNATNPLILGLTASPGGDEDRIKEVCQNLHIEAVEIRKENDPDVRPYVQKIDADWRYVALPEDFKKLQLCLRSSLERRLSTLRELGYWRNDQATKKGLLELRERLQGILSKELQPPREVFIGILMGNIAFKALHALELLETQGTTALSKYFERLINQKSKGAKTFLNDNEVVEAKILLRKLLAENIEHPKIQKSIEIIQNQLNDNPNSKIILFTHFRDTAEKMVNLLSKIDGIRPVRFVGQSDKLNDPGLSQKEQIEILERFRSGNYNVLVASQVAEEGLNIPSVDLVVFYEPVPSEIRTIQRRGRTGRLRPGKAVVLIAKGTRDEAYYWRSFYKEQKMRKILNYLPTELKPQPEQMAITEFAERNQKITIYVDSRELASGIGRELLEYNINIQSTQLEVADYLLSNRIGVERKTVEDFLQSLIDGRLLSQLIELKRNFAKPILIVEGEDLYSHRNIHPNAIRGVIASIAVDLGMPMIWTKDRQETAAFLFSIAKREQEEQKVEIRLRGEKKAMTLAEQQQFIVEGLPGISAELAKRLLEKFETIRKIVNASQEELKEVKGIGESRAKEIETMVTSKYQSEENEN
ncbi:MAG: DEAD/DEAH box helicase [Euryarchaeota archaeon]|nr:DEAD/DEAH box helicase [Euryarchaeota archaeon]